MVPPTCHAASSPQVLFSAPGVVKIGVLANKIFRFHLFSWFFNRILKNQNFRKIDFSKIDYFFSFYRFLRQVSIKIERGMKKYFWGLILRFVGLMGSSLVPNEGPGGAATIIIRPASRCFKNLPWVLFWDPRVVKIGILAKFHAGLTYFHNFPTVVFLKIMTFENMIFLKKGQNHVF